MLALLDRRSGGSSHSGPVGVKGVGGVRGVDAAERWLVQCTQQAAETRDRARLRAELAAWAAERGLTIADVVVLATDQGDVRHPIPFAAGPPGPGAGARKSSGL
jgi:hypothetical protein